MVVGLVKDGDENVMKPIPLAQLAVTINWPVKATSPGYVGMWVLLLVAI